VCAEGHVGYKNGNHADATLLPAGMKMNICSSLFCALNFAQQVEFDGGGLGFGFFFFNPWVSSHCRNKHFFVSFSILKLNTNVNHYTGRSFHQS